MKDLTKKDLEGMTLSNIRDDIQMTVYAGKLSVLNLVKLQL